MAVSVKRLIHRKSFRPRLETTNSITRPSNRPNSTSMRRTVQAFLDLPVKTNSPTEGRGKTQSSKGGRGRRERGGLTSFAKLSVNRRGLTAKGKEKPPPTAPRVSPLRLLCVSSKRTGERKDRGTRRSSRNKKERETDREGLLPRRSSRSQGNGYPSRDARVVSTPVRATRLIF